MCLPSRRRARAGERVPACLGTSREGRGGKRETLCYLASYVPGRLQEASRQRQVQRPRLAQLRILNSHTQSHSQVLHSNSRRSTRAAPDASLALFSSSGPTALGFHHLLPPECRELANPGWTSTKHLPRDARCPLPIDCTVPDADNRR